MDRYRLLTVAVGLILIFSSVAGAAINGNAERRLASDEVMSRRKEAMEKRQKAHRDFRKKVKGKSFSEQRSALKAGREKSSSKNEKGPSPAQQHEENMRVLKKELAKNEALSGKDKSELFSYYIGLYEKYKSAHGQPPAENIGAIGQVLTSSMPIEQKKAILESSMQEGKVGDGRSNLGQAGILPVPKAEQMFGEEAETSEDVEKGAE